MKPADQSADLNVYTNPDIVSNYTKESGFQPPERSILREFDSQMKDMCLLDIGIGAGRTTAELAPRVREYTGVDYSPDMIRVCEQRFPRENGRVSFAVCDARDMSRFGDSSFDFVLFSYNGIDCLPHEGRLQILAEVRRVLKPEGWFMFSSHNLLFFPLLFRFPWVRPISRMRRKIKTRRRLLDLYPNFRSIAREPHAFVYDGTFDLKARHYYIAPGPQVKQMNEAGFLDTRVFDEKGTEVNPETARLNRNAWIYYLSRRGK